MESRSAPYSATRERSGGVPVVRLTDAARRMEVLVAPPVGNMAYAFRVNGKNVLWFPFPGPEALQAAPALCGIPLLAPWANRIDGDAYWVNRRQFRLNPALGNLRRDGNQRPIHGLVLFSSAWRLISTGADNRSAYATSRLEFWRHPELMAQFPFAHDLSMTYRLGDGALQVETTLDNYATEPLPVAIGYHPYFQLHDVAPNEWRVHLAARDRWLLDRFLVPTGVRVPSPFADPHLLGARSLDDVLGSLIREDGVARFWVAGRTEKITVTYGPKYSVAVVYRPEGRNYICLEPLAALTNAFNLAHSGVGPDLETVPPAGQWRESFWITPEGF
jgi:aldose 1-epimerase